MFTTHIEKFCDTICELKPLFELHSKEISQHIKHGIPLDPDYVTYFRVEQAGELIFVALRSKGQLVGYFTGFIKRALHYNCLSLHQDLFYVSPQYRGKHSGISGGVLLLNRVKQEAERRGVRVWTMGVKEARGKHMRKLLTDAAFEPFETHYAYWF